MDTNSAASFFRAEGSTVLQNYIQPPHYIAQQPRKVRLLYNYMPFSANCLYFQPLFHVYDNDVYYHITVNFQCAVSQCSY